MMDQVSSGWNRSSSPEGKAKRKKGLSSAAKGLVAGGAVIIGIIAVLYFICGQDEGTLSSQATDQTRTIPEKGYKKLDDISRIKPRKQYETKPKTVKEALERLEEAQDPLKLEAMSENSASDTASKMIFTTGTEQVLSWLCHVDLGEPPMPPPPIPDDELANITEILISKNDVKDDDSPEAANAKQMVDAAKREMMKFIKEGGDPDEFMQYVFREQSKAFETRGLALDMYDELADEDPVLARDFVRQANEKLAEQGIKPIELTEVEGQEESQGEQDKAAETQTTDISTDKEEQETERNEKAE